MAASRAAIALQPSLLSRLEEARARTDSLFNLLPPNSFYDRPVPERHRLIFYLGHLEAFDQNLLSGPLGSEPQDATLDKLFAFGIDPVAAVCPRMSLEIGRILRMLKNTNGACGKDWTRGCTIEVHSDPATRRS